LLLRDGCEGPARSGRLQEGRAGGRKASGPRVAGGWWGGGRKRRRRRRRRRVEV